MRRALSLSRSLSVSASLLLTGAVPALAADTVVVTSPRTTTTTTPVETTGTLPNGSLLRSGVFTLGASYVPALIVAIESEHPADNHLYAPVVGPWFDLAARGDCEGECSSETVNKALLVTDGVFQGLGALQIVGAFLLPESRTIALRNDDGTTALAVSVTPASFGRGAKGLRAVGTF